MVAIAGDSRPALPEAELVHHHRRGQGMGIEMRATQLPLARPLPPLHTLTDFLVLN